MEGPYDPRRWTYEASPSRPEPRRRVGLRDNQPVTAIQHHPVPQAGPKDHAPTGSTAPVVAPSIQSSYRQPRSRVGLDGGAVLRGSYVGLLIACCILLWNVWPKPAGTDLNPTVKAYIDRAVDRAINKALRDPVGRRDFALLADGAILLPELTEVTSSHGVLRGRERGTQPEAALGDDLRIGSCWSIPGANGQLGFRLTTMIRPTHVSIDHIPLEIAADISCAPREIALWGGVDGPFEDILRNFTQSHRLTPPTIGGRSAPFVTHGYNFALLGHFEYDIRGPAPIQTFGLHPYVLESDMVFGVVVLEILSNWGGKSTCLYRVRVHGEAADVPL